MKVLVIRMTNNQVFKIFLIKGSSKKNLSRLSNSFDLKSKNDPSFRILFNSDKSGRLIEFEEFNGCSPKFQSNNI
jgi:hypothetical protein